MGFFQSQCWRDKVPYEKGRIGIAGAKAIKEGCTENRRRGIVGKRRMLEGKNVIGRD